MPVTSNRPDSVLDRPLGNGFKLPDLLAEVARHYLERARDGAQASLQDAVASLETIRLGLLRLHAGSGTVGGITQDLTNASEIAGDIERLLEGRSEVEAALKGEGVEPLWSSGSSLSSTQRTDPA